MATILLLEIGNMTTLTIDLIKLKFYYYYYYYYCYYYYQLLQRRAR